MSTATATAATTTTTTASQAQINANRANAQLSPGPRTEEGKRASSANSIQSGITGVKLYIRADEQEEYDKTYHLLLEQLKPSGILQCHFFDMILHASWNIQRCTALEAAIQNEAAANGLMDALLDDELSRKLDRIYRYKKTHESTHRKAITEFRRLKTEECFRACRGGDLAQESVLMDAQAVVTALNRIKATAARQELDSVRTEIETFINAPVAQHHRSASIAKAAA
jgi:hypothetical protein